MLAVLLDLFCRSDTKLSMSEFVARATAFPQFFDSLGIREEVKREIVLAEERLVHWR